VCSISLRHILRLVELHLVIDYSLDVGCQVTEDGLELLYARSRIINASKAADIGSQIDAVYPFQDNGDGLLKETINAKKLGFRSKLIIHPKQIEIVNSIFTVSNGELEEAKIIVSAFEEAIKQGKGVITVGKKMVDYPVYKRAIDLLLNTFNL
jgi:citrate lyase subunit beta / citryl-CoA lyase